MATSSVPPAATPSPMAAPSSVSHLSVRSRAETHLAAQRYRQSLPRVDELVRDKRFADAIVVLLDAVKRHSHDTESYRRLIESYRMLDLQDAARVVAVQLARLSPNDLVAGLAAFGDPQLWKTGNVQRIKAGTPVAKGPLCAVPCQYDFDGETPLHDWYLYQNGLPVGRLVIRRRSHAAQEYAEYAISTWKHERVPLGRAKDLPGQGEMQTVVVAFVDRISGHLAQGVQSTPDKRLPPTDDELLNAGERLDQAVWFYAHQDLKRAYRSAVLAASVYGRSWTQAADFADANVLIAELYISQRRLNMATLHMSKAASAYGLAGQLDMFLEALAGVAALFLWQGKGPAALRVLRYARQYAQNHGQSQILAVIDLSLGNAEMLMGRYRLARLLYQRCQGYATSHGETYQTTLAENIKMLGQREELRQKHLQALHAWQDYRDGKRTEAEQALSAIASEPHVSALLAAHLSAIRDPGDLKVASEFVEGTLSKFWPNDRSLQDCHAAVEVRLAVQALQEGHAWIPRFRLWREEAHLAALQSALIEEWKQANALAAKQACLQAMEFVYHSMDARCRGGGQFVQSLMWLRAACSLDLLRAGSEQRAREIIKRCEGGSRWALQGLPKCSLDAASAPVAQAVSQWLIIAIGNCRSDQGFTNEIVERVPQTCMIMFLAGQLDVAVSLFRQAYLAAPQVAAGLARYLPADASYNQISFIMSLLSGIELATDRSGRAKETLALARLRAAAAQIVANNDQEAEGLIGKAAETSKDIYDLAAEAFAQTDDSTQLAAELKAVGYILAGIEPNQPSIRRLGALHARLLAANGQSSEALAVIGQLLKATPTGEASVRNSLEMQRRAFTKTG